MSPDYSPFLASLSGFLPELALACCAILLAAAGFVFRRRAESDRALRLFGLAAIAGLLGACALLATQAALLVYPHGEPNPFGAEWLFKGEDMPYGFGAIVVDGMAILLKAAVAAAVLGALWGGLADRSGSSDRHAQAAFGPMLLVAMTLGMFVTVGSNDLIATFAGLEITSLAAYGAVGLAGARRAVPSKTLRAVLYGAVASALMLVGIALLYGLVGSSNYGVLELSLGAPNTENALVNPLAIASLLIFVGIATRVGLAPFHVWSAALAEDAPPPLAACVVAGGGVAALGALVRFVVTVYPETMQGFNWGPIIGGVAVLTASLGGIAALRQRALTRAVARISIAQSGFIVAGLAAGTRAGVAAVLIASVCHVAVATAALHLAGIAARGSGSDTIDALRGYGRRRPLAAAAFTIVLLAAAGFPLTAGFTALLVTLNALLAAGNTYLWLVAMLGGCLLIVVAWCLRVVAAIWFQRPATIAAADAAAGPGARPAIAFGELLPALVFTLATVAFGMPGIVRVLLGVADDALRGIMPYLRDVG